MRVRVRCVWGVVGVIVCGEWVYSSACVHACSGMCDRCV